MRANLPELTRELAKALVDYPEDLFVETSGDRDFVRIELEVAEEDLGRVIGRSGRTARALRQILSAAADQDERRVSLDILE
ncbi:MAG: KH domain-containing protein [Acidobacteriota bacterium]|nr:KH domain-containing protein [Acidobacteriota bacterium]